jgi:16S rRNA (cytosine1402-N4)-methyltransferase
MDNIYHKPVFVDTFLQYLNILPGQDVLDCTCGEGGHSSIILKSLENKGFLVSVDRDREILEIARKRLFDISNNFMVLNYSYSQISEIQKESKIDKFDRMIVDLGLSTYHIEKKDRGFSFTSNEPLDMRYDRDKTQISALDVVNKYKEKVISDIIYTFGEDRMANKIAYAIISERKRNPINTCKQLAEIVRKVYGFSYGRINCATKTFQALRIFVNSELKELNKLLEVLHLATNKDGIVGIISYHSLEDRIIKNYFKNSAEFKPINKKVIKPELEEIHKNPSSRSAKLRLGLKL